MTYQDADRVRATYFDSEGHLIQYSVEASDDAGLIFISDAVPTAPRFRLRYIPVDLDTVDVTFAVAPPRRPEAFEAHAGGRIKKVKQQ